MYEIEIHQTINRIVKLYNFLGIWRNEEESNGRKRGRQIFFISYFILVVLYYILCAFCSDNINNFIFMLEVAIGVAVVGIKALYVFWKEKAILEFLYNRIVAHSTESRQRWEEVNVKLNSFMTCVHIYLYELYGALIFIIVSCSPLFFEEKTLPLYINFSMIWKWKYFDIMYWPTYVFAAMGFVFSCVFILVTVIVWYLMFTYSIEYQELGIQLKSLGTTEEKSQSAEYGAYARDLVRLIKAHRSIFESIERFKECFATLFLAQITTSGFSLCIILYNLANSSSEDVVLSAIFVATLLYTLLDIFLIMYLANGITAASYELSYCLFESNWIEQSESCKKCIIIMCEGIKKPQQLVVHIYPMNLATFTSIINIAYKMFNLLKSFQ